MRCSKLSYYESDEVLELNPFFTDVTLEKNSLSEKDCLSLYSYGINGMKKDGEVKCAADHIDFGTVGYDPRLGMWLSVDSMFGLSVHKSPFQFSKFKHVS